MSAYVTIWDIALARGAKQNDRGAVTANEFWRVGLDILGGCQTCGATLSAGNGYPSRTGFWMCSSDIADLGFSTVREFERWDKAHHADE